MRFGMLALALFFVVAFVLESALLNETQAVENAKKTMHLRLRPTIMVGKKVGAEV